MTRHDTLYSTVESPLGDLLLVSDGADLTGLYMQSHKGWPSVGQDWRRDEEHFAAVVAQLKAYFAGERRDFELSLAPRGTPFQLSVWRTMASVPYGQTITYGQLAAGIGLPTAARAVGQASGRNPIPIIVPCHRVIGTAGSLTGYGGGIERKRWLLELEAAVSAG
jgi:methylated-DNA-[protein]-cysteine S-methyltransferase